MHAQENPFPVLIGDQKRKNSPLIHFYCPSANLLPLCPMLKIRIKSRPITLTIRHCISTIINTCNRRETGSLKTVQRCNSVKTGGQAFHAVAVKPVGGTIPRRVGIFRFVLSRRGVGCKMRVEYVPRQGSPIHLPRSF